MAHRSRDVLEEWATNAPLAFVDQCVGNLRQYRAIAMDVGAYRRLDTVVMGNKRLWAALEERDRVCAMPEMNDADGMRLGELEGIVGEEDGYSAESDAAVLLDGLDIPETLHGRKMGELQGGARSGDPHLAFEGNHEVVDFKGPYEEYQSTSV